MTFTIPTELGELFVRVAGSLERGRGVLLLHANPGDSRDYDAVVDVLAEEWPVVTVDWPGYGRSTVTEPTRVTAESLVGAAEDVLDELDARGIHEVSIVGNSVGGYVAARLAQRRPDAVLGLVLVDPAGFSPQNVAVRLFCREVMGQPRLARLLIAPLARAYLGRLRTSSARATYVRARDVARDPRRLAVHSAVWRSFADPRVDLTGAELATPTLLVWGRRDPVVPALVDGRRARRALPHADMVVLPTGHEPFNERPREFLGVVVPFLRRIDSRPRQAADARHPRPPQRP